MANHPHIPQDNGFYTSQPQLESLFAQGCASRFAGKTAADLAAWQRTARATLRSLLGLDTFEEIPPKVYTLDAENCGTYTRTKYVLQTEAQVYMPFFVLRPNGMAVGEARPVVICPNGHFNRAKESVAAVRHEAGVLEDMEKFHTHHAEDFANRGYIAVCPDARGFGERAERNVHADGLWKCSCAKLNKMAVPLGRCALGMNVWDLLKLTDYLTTRADCDAARIGCAGLSGGGLQSMFLAAVDERIRCACTSGYFYGYLNAMLQGDLHCECNYVPNLWRHFDMGDIAALVAPRAFLVETGLRDALNGESGIANVLLQVDIARRAYTAAGYADRLQHSVFDVDHVWVGTDTYPFFDKFLALE